MRRKIRYGSALLLTAALWLAGCRHSTPPPPAIDGDPKVFIMYDNIGSWFNDDVDEAGKAVADGALIEGQRVVVFHKRSGGNEIYELVRDPSNTAGYRKEMLHKYAAGEMNTLTPENIRAVIGWIRTNIPEANHWGLAFGSHGTGWIPKNYTGPLGRRATDGQADEFAALWEFADNPVTRYLAYDSSQKIDISEFADALDEWKWDFILFDDCFMASIEAQYEMRHLAERFIASPTEIMSAGFPYDRVVKVLFSDWTNLGGVASTFVDYYRNSVSPYATISVVKTSELEALMQSVREIRRAGYNEVDPVSSEIQFFEELTSHVFFDLDDYMSHFSRDEALYGAFLRQLQKTVEFSAHTDRFYSYMLQTGTHYPVNRFSGLSVFIPWSGTSRLIPAYEQTEWYKAVYR